MPLTAKGTEIMANLTKEYGAEKGKQVFYAGKNKGTFTGVDEDCTDDEKLDEIACRADALTARFDAFFEQPAQSVKDAKSSRYVVSFSTSSRGAPEEMTVEASSGKEAEQIVTRKNPGAKIVQVTHQSAFTADDLRKLNDVMTSGFPAKSVNQPMGAVDSDAGQQRRKWPSYTNAELEKFIAEGSQKSAEMQQELEDRNAGKSKSLVTPQVEAPVWSRRK